MSALESGGGYVPLSAGHGVSSDPERVTASTLASSPHRCEGFVSREGSQAGISLTQSEIQLAYHLLRGLPYPNAAVGAAVVQVEGELAGVVGSSGRHVPKHASEPFHEVGNLTHNSGKTARAYG